MSGYLVGFRTYLIAFFIAAAVCAVVIPYVRRLALRWEAVSGVGGRNVHARKIPRLGGLGICLALFAPILGLLLVENAVADLFRREIWRVVGLAAGGLVMCALGALDDTRGVRALYKLYAQVAVACFAHFCGFKIDAVTLPYFGVLSMGVFSLPVTVAWIVGIVNAVNLIDGLDGLAAGVVFFAGVTNFVVALISGQAFSALIMAAMMGAVLAFLFYNFNPARIFMGDSGSYLLGYVLAATALAGVSQKASTAVALLVPVVALGVPIFDTLFAIVRRFLERRPLFSPDRGHIHHRLLDLGITHRRAVLILYGVSVVFTVAAIAIYLGRSWQVGLALLVATIVLVGLVRFVGYFSYTHFRTRQRARIRTRDTELLRHLVPTFGDRFACADSEQELFDELVGVAEEAELTLLELRRPDDPDNPVVAYADRRSDARQVIALMTYPLGPDALCRAELRVGTVNDFEEEEMSPQTDILLQVLADVLAAHLRRLGSELAPRVSEPLARDSSAALRASRASAALRASRASDARRDTAATLDDLPLGDLPLARDSVAEAAAGSAKS